MLHAPPGAAISLTDSWKEFAHDTLDQSDTHLFSIEELEARSRWRRWNTVTGHAAGAGLEVSCTFEK